MKQHSNEGGTSARVIDSGRGRVLREDVAPKQDWVITEEEQANQLPELIFFVKTGNVTQTAKARRPHLSRKGREKPFIRRMNHEGHSHVQSPALHNSTTHSAYSAFTTHIQQFEFILVN
ncbi:hypothetical protein AAHC03_020750 [Spirometra sp. Aus1]